MYERMLKFYKGIDNQVQFQFYNHDNKKVNIGDHTIKFNLLDKENRATKISQNLTVTNASKGIATLNLTESQTRMLTSQFYNYSLQVTDNGEGISKLIYAGTDYDASGTAEVLSGIYPDFVESKLINAFTVDGKHLKSSAIDSTPANNSNQAIHSVQLFLEDFTGDVVIKGSLDDTADYATGNAEDWSNVIPDGEADEILSFSDNTSQPIFTFKGVYSKVAFDILYSNASAGERSLGIGPLGAAGFQIGEQTGTASGDTDVSTGQPFVGGSSFIFAFTDEHGVEHQKTVTLAGDGSTTEDFNHFINAFNSTTNGIPAKYLASKQSNGKLKIENTVNSSDKFKLLLQGVNKILYRS